MQIESIVIPFRNWICILFLKTRFTITSHFVLKPRPWKHAWKKVSWSCIKKDTPQSQNKNNMKGHTLFGKQWNAILIFTRARFWSWKQKLRNTNHDSLANNDLKNDLKKKEDESSNTLQSDGNEPTCSKETDEVVTVNGNKIWYVLSAIIPLVNLHGNLSKFLTKTSFSESAQAGLSIGLTLFPNSVFWIFLNLRLLLRTQNKCSFVAWEFT